MKKFLMKIDRVSAWGLFISMLLFFISGYGMTKGIISSEWSIKLHLNVLTYFIIIFFVIHTFYAISLAFKRWQIWNRFTITGLIIFYLLFISFFVYVDKIYQPRNSSENNSTSNEISNIETPTASTGTPTTNSETSTQKTFTKEELAKYNGENGQSAYLAVDGKVYDLTSIFKNGSHFSHYAGQELTNAFYSYHAKSALSKYPIVGILE